MLWKSHFCIIAVKLLLFETIENNFVSLCFSEPFVIIHRRKKGKLFFITFFPNISTKREKSEWKFIRWKMFIEKFLLVFSIDFFERFSPTVNRVRKKKLKAYFIQMEIEKICFPIPIFIKYIFFRYFKICSFWENIHVAYNGKSGGAMCYPRRKCV